MISSQTSGPQRPQQRRGIPLEKLLATDPNGDGKLTVEELREVANATFTLVDSNGDGLISREEYKAVSQQVQIVNTVENSPVCPVPLPPKGAKVLVFSAYEGNSISSAWVGGPDQETNLIDVTIERGKEPLYLVLISYELMIWRLSGDTGRVARTVVNSHQAAVPGTSLEGPGSSRKAEQAENRVAASGVMGLPAEKVTIVRPDCWRYFTKPGELDAGLALALVQRSLGQKPDAVIASYSLQNVNLPSAKVVLAERDIAPVPKGFDPKMWREAIRFWPGGLVQVDPKKVVAQSPVATYEVLPSQMGLSQLIGAGAIEYYNGRSLRVVKPIAHLPPSMGGAHSATLVLAKGVPLPPGDPVHACIISEETGDPVVKGPLCSVAR